MAFDVVTFGGFGVCAAWAPLVAFDVVTFGGFGVCAAGRTLCVAFDVVVAGEASVLVHAVLL
ncbi:MAG: hypothetical protein WKF73_16705 [Nocardioidaceae bacterium]